MSHNNIILHTLHLSRGAATTHSIVRLMRKRLHGIIIRTYIAILGITLTVTVDVKRAGPTDHDICAIRRPRAFVL